MRKGKTRFGKKAQDKEPQEIDASNGSGKHAKKKVPKGLRTHLPLVLAVLAVLCLVVSVAPLALIFSIAAFVLIFRDKDRRKRLLTTGSATLICAAIAASCSVYALVVAPSSPAPTDNAAQSEAATSKDDKADQKSQKDKDDEEPEFDGGMVTISLSVEDWTGSDTPAVIDIQGTTKDGATVQDSIKLAPGDRRTLYYEAGSYTANADGAAFSTEEVIYASATRAFTVDDSNLSVVLTVEKDDEAIAAKQAEKAAAEEAQRQAEEAAAQEAQRQAEAAAEAQRQAEAAAEAQRQADAAAAAQAQQQSQQNEETVYITNTGEKYHRDGCQYLSKCKHAISLSDAQALGYTPCSRCF